eukprot:51600-Pelagomonas_calceolata.AAC.1
MHEVQQHKLLLLNLLSSLLMCHDAVLNLLLELTASPLASCSSHSSAKGLLTKAQGASHSQPLTVLRGPHFNSYSKHPQNHILLSRTFSHAPN